MHRFNEGRAGGTQERLVWWSRAAAFAKTTVRAGSRLQTLPLMVCWQRVDLQKVIKERFGVDYHERHVSTFLKMSHASPELLLDVDPVPHLICSRICVAGPNQMRQVTMATRDELVSAVMLFVQFAAAAQAAIASMRLGSLPALDLPIKSAESHYLAWPRERENHAPFAFRNWLVAETTAD